ncbi:MAG: efflux RND transporter periplasmic adaptor subunit [Rhodospirillales bacterium]|nr:efflux RND transporter periplasmic adaptor subunit [Rhodospirillales bacterium]
MNREHLSKAFSTFLLLIIAAIVIAALWIRYQVEPVTRDGKVAADIVQVTPDVGGWVTSVAVQDNEAVKKGQPLLTIDQSRYQLALAQAQAALNGQQIALAQAIRDDRRNHALSALVDVETIEKGTEQVGLLQSAVAKAKAALDLAQLNLDRTTLRAPVDGIISNMTLQPGDYLSAGKEAFALVDTDTLRIEGYFVETKIPAINIGDKADIRLMGVARIIHGHVESIAGGIVNRERDASANMLDNIEPEYTYVRLAQRIPVRIAIDQVPAGMRLIAGQTASVEILPRQGEAAEKRSWPW